MSHLCIFKRLFCLEAVLLDMCYIGRVCDLRVVFVIWGLCLWSEGCVCGLRVVFVIWCFVFVLTAREEAGSGKTRWDDKGWSAVEGAAWQTAGTGGGDWTVQTRKCSSGETTQRQRRGDEKGNKQCLKSEVVETGNRSQGPHRTLKTLKKNYYTYSI